MKTISLFTQFLHRNPCVTSIQAFLFLLHSHKHFFLLVTLTFCKKYMYSSKPNIFMQISTQHAIKRHFKGDIRCTTYLQECPLGHDPGFSEWLKTIWRVAKAREHRHGNHNAYLFTPKIWFLGKCQDIHFLSWIQEDGSQLHQISTGGTSIHPIGGPCICNHTNIFSCLKNLQKRVQTSLGRF